MSDDSSNTPGIEQKSVAPRRPKLLAIIEATVTTFVLLVLPAFAAGYLFFAISGGLPADETIRQFIYVIIVELLILSLLIWLMKRFGLTWRAIGVLRPAPSALGWALLGFGAYLLAYMFIFAAVNGLISLDTEQRQELGFDTGVGGIQLAFVFISLVILPPLIEEIIFRGYIYTRLRRAFKVLPAAIIVSILFALGHLQFGSGNALLWVAALDTFILSMVLVGLREKTGNIWAGVGVHALKNGLAFTSLFILGL